MLHLVRTAQPNQVAAIMSDQLRKAADVIPTIRENVTDLARQSARQRDFLSEIEKMGVDLTDLGEKTGKLSPDRSISVHENLKNRSQNVADKMSIIYLSVIQSTDDFLDDEDLMLSQLQKLEGVLVQAETPDYKKHAGVKSIPTPEEIAVAGQDKFDAFLATLVEFKGRFASDSVSCFISYEWGSKSFVHQMADHLEMGGIKVFIDKNEPTVGKNLAEMEDRIRTADRVLLCGSITYGKKSSSSNTSGVRDEVPAIQERFSRNREAVLQVLLQGSPIRSFPALLNTQRFGYADCREAKNYFFQVVQLFESLHKQAIARDPQLKSFIEEKKTFFA